MQRTYARVADLTSLTRYGFLIGSRAWNVGKCAGHLSIPIQQGAAPCNAILQNMGEQECV